MLRCLSFISALLRAFLRLLRALLPLVIADHKVDHLTELHSADVLHRQSSFESCEDDVVERDG